MFLVIKCVAHGSLSPETKNIYQILGVSAYAQGKYISHVLISTSFNSIRSFIYSAWASLANRKNNLLSILSNLCFILFESY